MKHLRRSAFAFVVTTCLLLGTSCRGVQINQLEKQVSQLETRVAVLESQMAALDKK